MNNELYSTKKYPLQILHLSLVVDVGVLRALHVYTCPACSEVSHMGLEALQNIMSQS